MNYMRVTPKDKDCAQPWFRVGIKYQVVAIENHQVIILLDGGELGSVPLSYVRVTHTDAVIDGEQQ